MPEPAIAAAASQGLAVLLAVLPSNVRAAGAWGVLALLVGVMLFSLVTHAFQRTSVFILRQVWPALLLLGLQAAGIVPAPGPEVLNALFNSDEPRDTPQDRGWQTWWQ